MASNAVAEVTAYVTKAIKSKSSTVQTPSKWATDAGFSGSAASPLREHIARASDNGCGRSGRYPKVSAEGMLELIELGHQYKDAEGAKQETLRKRIGTKVRPAQAATGRKAKTQATKSASKPRKSSKTAA